MTNNDQPIINKSLLEKEEEKDKQQSNIQGMVSMLTGFLIMVYSGNIYLWGNISTYVVSYFHYLGDDSATLQSAMLLLPLAILVQTTLNPTGAWLQRRYNPKLIHLASGIVMIGSILMCAYVKKWWQFVVLFGIIFPIGASWEFFTNINISWEWYPEYKGLSGGIMIGGYGLAVFVFGIITTSIANPGNLEVEIPSYGSKTDDKLFPLEVALRVPEMLIQCAKYGVACCLIAVIGVTRNPEAIHALKLEKEKTQPTTMLQCMKSKQFIMLIIMFFNSMFFSMFVSSVYKITPEGKIGDHTLTIAGTLGSLFNGLSRPIWGYILDKHGFKISLGAMCILQVLTACPFFWLRDYPILYVIAVILAFNFLGGLMGLFISVQPKIFGIQLGPSLASITTTFVGITAMFGFLLVKFGNIPPSQHWILFMLGAALTVVDLIMLYYFDESSFLQEKDAYEEME